MSTHETNIGEGGAPISIDANIHPEIGPLVNIVQSMGGMRFQHSMKPIQARDMAAMLIVLANSFDKETS